MSAPDCLCPDCYEQPERDDGFCEVCAASGCTEDGIRCFAPDAMYPDGAPVKRCACGLRYTAAEFLALPRVGPWLDLILANCTCGSTIAVHAAALGLPALEEAS